MTDNPYAHLFNDEPFDVVDPEAAMPNKARAAADRHGDDYITVGGTTMPHPAPFPAEGMWPHPAVSIKFDAEQFQARMAEAREQIAELLEPVGAALANLGPVFEQLGRTFAAIVYVTDGTPPPVAHDGPSALAALAYAETTEVLRRPSKRHRAAAKRHYLAVRRHLDPAHRQRLRRVPVNQFGGLA